MSYTDEQVQELIAERDQLAELLEAAGVDAKEIKEENARLRRERESVTETLADLLIGGSIGKLSIENGELVQPARDASIKAEALEALNPHDLSRFAKSIGKDAWDMNPVGICRVINRMAHKHRKQSEDNA